MSKATHNGECQLCGRQQKLPSDVLSKHGYTVEWGFFNGTCPGSGHKSFELSCDLIDGRLKDIRLAIETEKELCEKLLNDPVNPEKVMIHFYQEGGYQRGQRSGYVWQESKLRKLETPIRGSYFQALQPKYWKEDEHWESIPTNGMYNATIEDVAKDQTKKYVEARRKGYLADLERYEKWLSQRKQSWVLKPLKAIVQPTDARKSSRGVYILQGREGFYVKYRMRTIFRGTKEECVKYRAENFK